MSDGMRYDFASIEGGAGEIQGAVATTNGLLDEGKGSLAALQSVWSGSAEGAYTQVQMRWDATSAELNDALQKLAQAISEAGQQMASTEAGITGMFG